MMLEYCASCSLLLDAFFLAVVFLGCRPPRYRIRGAAVKDLFDCICLFDSTSQPERILLLDAFFLVVVFLGATVDGWRRAGYHENPEHTEFA